MATRTELVEAVGERYRSVDRCSKGRILDEFVAVTGFHRKHAMRLLQADRPLMVSGVRFERRIYDEAARTALIVLWEAADRLCGKRLQPLIPILLEAMERHGHLDLAPDLKTQLTTMSAATIDRALRDVKGGSRAQRRRGVAGTALRQSVPIRTFDDWGDPAPGHIEADLVSHSGPVAKGSFAWTFTLTDIATGWTECAPLLVRELMVPRFSGHGFRPCVVRLVPGSCIRGRSGSAGDYSSPRCTRTGRVAPPRGLAIAAGGQAQP